MQQITFNDQLKPILADALGFIAGNIRQMATLCLPILLVTTVVGFSLARIYHSTLNAVFVPFLFNLLVYPLYTAALIQLMIAKARRDQPTNMQLLLMAARQWGPLFLLKLIMVVMIFAGSILIIPGLWLWVRLSFAEFYLVAFGYKPQDAIQKSLAATKPFGMMIFIILLMSYIPILAMDLIADSIILSLTQSLFLSILSNAFFSFLALFVLVILFRVFMESINRQQASSQPSTS